MSTRVFCVLLQQGNDATNFVSGLELMQECGMKDISLLSADVCGVNT